MKTRASSRNGILIPVLAMVIIAGLLLPRGIDAQRLGDFTTPLPLAPGGTLVLGFMGGRDHWNDATRAVRKLAMKLREANLPGLHVETVENTQRDVALRFVRQALDRNRDGTLDPDERGSARILLYGHSFGGAAVLKFARQLEKIGVPVLLTVQVDSVGLDDAEVPPNVARAANLYQRNGLFIQGEPEIRAVDPARTQILGNLRFDYSRKEIDLSREPWHKTLFRRAHAKMEHDPEVWQLVEKLIREAAAPESKDSN